LIGAAHFISFEEAKPLHIREEYSISEAASIPSNLKQTPSIPSDFQTKHWMSFFKGIFPFGRPSPFTSNQRREREIASHKAKKSTEKSSGATSEPFPLPPLPLKKISPLASLRLPATTTPEASWAFLAVAPPRSHLRHR
jgi:hypothetical protein